MHVSATLEGPSLWLWGCLLHLLCAALPCLWHCPRPLFPGQSFPLYWMALIYSPLAIRASVDFLPFNPLLGVLSFWLSSEFYLSIQLTAWSSLFTFGGSQLPQSLKTTQLCVLCPLLSCPGHIWKCPKQQTLPFGSSSRQPEAPLSLPGAFVGQ